MISSEMPTPEFLHDELQFRNYEVLQIKSTRDNGDTEWFYSKPNTHFSAFIDESNIEFRQLAGDGETDFIVEMDGFYDRTFLKQQSVLLGGQTYSRAVRLMNSNEWVWHAFSVAQPDVVNKMADEILTGVGAHMLPLVLRQPDRENGRFTSMAWARALSLVHTHFIFFMICMRMLKIYAQ